MTQSPKGQAHLRAAFLLMTLALSGAFLYFGTVHGDEGWNLSVAREVYRGKLLYRDVAYDGAPLFPYVYGIVQQDLWPGLLGGRLVSLLLLCGTSALMLRMGERAGGRIGVIVAGAVFALNSYTIYFMTIAKTLALPVFFLTLALYLLVMRPGHPGWIAAALGAAFLGTLSRITALPAVIGIALYGAWTTRGQGLRMLFLALPALLFLLLGLGWAAADALEQAYYFNITYYLELHERLAPGAFLLKKLHQLLAFGEKFYLFPLLFLGLGLLQVRHRLLRPAWDSLRRSPRALLVLGVLIGITAAHLAPKEMLREYHLLVLPFLTVGAARAGAWTLERVERGRRLRLTRLTERWLLVVAATGLVTGYSHFWPLGGHPTATIREAGQFLRRRASPRETVFAMKPEITLEARLPSHPSTEMGEYSFTRFQDEGRARRYHLLTREMAEALLINREPTYVILSIDSHEIARPGTIRGPLSLPPEWVRRVENTLWAGRVYEALMAQYALLKIFSAWPHSDRVYLLYHRTGPPGAGQRSAGCAGSRPIHLAGCVR